MYERHCLYTIFFACVHQSGDIPNTLDFATKNGFDHNAVIGTLKSLLADNYVTMEAEDHEAYKLLGEGENALKNGSPEAQIYKLVSYHFTVSVAEWSRLSQM